MFLFKKFIDDAIEFFLNFVQPKNLVEFQLYFECY